MRQNEEMIVDLVQLVINGAVPEDIRSALILATRNDLLLTAIRANEAIESDVQAYLAPSLQEKLEENRYLEHGTQHLMKQLLARLSKAGVQFLTIKSFLPFPYLDSNVDLVVIGGKDVRKARQQFYELGYKRYRNLADIREPMKEIYRAVSGSEGSIFPYLHLHEAISWNGVVYLDAHKAWQRRRYREWQGVEIPIPSVDDEILIIAAHAMFENKYLTLSDLLHLYYLVQESPDWSIIFATAKTYSWTEALQTFLAISSEAARRLGLEIPLPVDLPQRRPIKHLTMPLVIPLSETLSVSLRKLYRDLRKGKLAGTGRALFTYFLVDPFWMYRKALRKL